MSELLVTVRAHGVIEGAGLAAQVQFTASGRRSSSAASRYGSQSFAMPRVVPGLHSARVLLERAAASMFKKLMAAR